MGTWMDLMDGFNGLKWIAGWIKADGLKWIGGWIEMDGLKWIRGWSKVDGLKWIRGWSKVDELKWIGGWIKVGGLKIDRWMDGTSIGSLCKSENNYSETGFGLANRNSKSNVHRAT